MNAANKIRLSRSIVGPREAEAVRRVIEDDGYLGMGNEVKLFEAEIAAHLGVPSETVVCVNSGTAAVHLAVQAAVNRGDEVLVQSLTFVATFQAISAAGGVPVPCEALPETCTIDLADAEKKITAKTKAIVPVHYAGNPGDLGAIYAFAAKYNLRVVEDAAHAFGGRHNGTMIGSTGDTACFSFDGIKNITSGEGGAIVSRDKRLLNAVKDARLLGIEKDTEKRYAGGRSWEFDVTRQGYRYHMSNIFAAIGRVQLERLASEFGEKRISLAADYRNRLKGEKGITLFADSPGTVPHIFAVRVPHGKRDALRSHLEAHGVESGIHYKPNHLLTLYGGGAAKLPVTESLYGEIVSLPLHPGLEARDVERVCALISSFLS